MFTKSFLHPQLCSNYIKKGGLFSIVKPQMPSRYTGKISGPSFISTTEFEPGSVKHYLMKALLLGIVQYLVNC
jgi:hypothetical protein